jgi:hypothetical protein
MATMSRWKTAVIALSAGAILLLGACSSSDDEEADAGTSASPVAESSAAAESSASTEETATAEPMADEPMETTSALAALDGLVCTGEWRNETFGSTGSFAATFAVGAEGGATSPLNWVATSSEHRVARSMRL